MSQGLTRPRQKSEKPRTYCQGQGQCLDPQGQGLTSLCPPENRWVQPPSTQPSLSIAMSFSVSFLEFHLMCPFQCLFTMLFLSSRGVWPIHFHFLSLQYNTTIEYNVTFTNGAVFRLDRRFCWCGSSAHVPNTFVINFVLPFYIENSAPCTIRNALCVVFLYSIIIIIMGKRNRKLLSCVMVLIAKKLMRLYYRQLLATSRLVPFGTLSALYAYFLRYGDTEHGKIRYGSDYRLITTGP